MSPPAPPEATSGSYIKPLLCDDDRATIMVLARALLPNGHYIKDFVSNIFVGDTAENIRVGLVEPQERWEFILGSKIKEVATFGNESFEEYTTFSISDAYIEERCTQLLKDPSAVFADKGRFMVRVLEAAKTATTWDGNPMIAPEVADALIAKIPEHAQQHSWESCTSASTAGLAPSRG